MCTPESTTLPLRCISGTRTRSFERSPMQLVLGWGGRLLGLPIQEFHLCEHRPQSVPHPESSLAVPTADSSALQLWLWTRCFASQLEPLIAPWFEQLPCGPKAQGTASTSGNDAG